VVTHTVYIITILLGWWFTTCTFYAHHPLKHGTFHGNFLTCVNLGYTVWMDIYYNSPSLCSLLKDNVCQCRRHTPAKQEHVPQLVGSKQLAKGDSIAAECKGIMVMKWTDKIETSFTSMFNENTMQIWTLRGTKVSKSRCIRHYNLTIGSVDLKDQMAEAWVVE
jgi:hypothetical protein